MQITRRMKILAASAAGILAALVGLMCLGSFGFSERTVKGQHVAQVDWLPKTANDITYIMNTGGLFPWLCFEKNVRGSVPLFSLFLLSRLGTQLFAKLRFPKVPVAPFPSSLAGWAGYDF